MGSRFDDNAEPNFKSIWSDISAEKSDTDEARKYFNGSIAMPLYAVADVTKLQQEKEKLRQLKHRLNEWEYVDVDNLGSKNQILSGLLGDFEDGDSSDYWLTLIAFTGFGAHRTRPFKRDNGHNNAYFANDVLFLGQYQVRPGYEKYGAAAYFDQKYHVTQIYLAQTNENYYPPNDDGTGSTIAQWEHAKWAWKVSVSVATFLVDFVCHSRFRESNAWIKAIRDHLSANHPVRRLLTPFTLGTVQSNRVMNEYLRANGLYHRCFAFSYKELQRLIGDSMSDAPKLEKGKTRNLQDQMRFRFRLFRKKVGVMKKLPDEVYPIYTDVWDFWVQTLKFVEYFIEVFYNKNDADDSLLEKDGELFAFYEGVLANLGVAKNKYRYKKFNVINLLTHFMSGASIWDTHLNGACSFEYSIDPDFTGLKIVGNNAKQNNIPQYIEYCALALSKGWQMPNFMLKGWENVLRGGNANINNQQLKETTKLFQDYFGGTLKSMSESIADRNKSRLAPYNGVNPYYVNISMRL